MPVDLSNYLKASAIWAPAVIRLVLGIIFMAHGAQKLFGAFGGPKISGTAGFLGQLGIQPALFWAWVVALVEFFGGLGILLGLLTSIASILIIIDMLVAITFVHGRKGFFAGAGGFEYNLALIAMAISLILSGPGVLSLDRLIGWRL
jgi:putative oxidoreductase